MIDKLKEEVIAVIKPITDNIATFTEKIGQIEETACKAIQLATEPSGSYRTVCIKSYDTM